MSNDAEDRRRTQGKPMMSSILTRLFAVPAILAPAGFAPSAPALHLVMPVSFAGFRTRRGGGRRKGESADVPLSWAEFGRGF